MFKVFATDVVISKAMTTRLRCSFPSAETVSAFVWAKRSTMPV